MKLFSLCLLAIALGTFFTGCASEDNGYYTPTQVAAQHSGYDPTYRLSGTSY
ncbi:MAG: hypothetical protein M3Y86_04010 [Verrucomicrobiota bacterium]|nr:hypothetical protein [Verrucomicrobiota bacterium]